MTHLFLNCPTISILQNMDYFLNNLDIEWVKKINAYQNVLKSLR